MKQQHLNLGVLSFGNILEWYDFSLYIYFAHSIAQEFFSDKNQFISYLLALSTFFIGSLARPLGGLLLGWLGDRFDHHRLINIAIIIMGGSTFAVALLPTYTSIGIAAPILLILLRIMQGLSAGGQFPGLITVAVKDFVHHRGFAVGLVFSVSSLGFFLASAVAFAIAELSPHHLKDISWRFPFALSGLLFLIYLYMQRKISTTPIIQKFIPAKKSSAIISLLHQWRTMLAVVALTCMGASLYYFVFTYLVGYRINYLQTSQESAFLLNSFILLLVCFLYPIFGYIADKVGYCRVFLIPALILLISAHPLLVLFKLENPLSPLITLLIFTICMAAIQGAISPLFAIAFEDEWIATGCALAFSIGNGLSGGAPLIAEALQHYLSFGLTLFVTTIMLIGFFGMWLIRIVLL